MHHDLNGKLFDPWVYGKSKTFICQQNIMGISDNHEKVDGKGPNNRPSTLPIYKPGTPSLKNKIHKLE